MPEGHRLTEAQRLPGGEKVQIQTQGKGFPLPSYTQPLLFYEHLPGQRHLQKSISHKIPRQDGNPGGSHAEKGS